MCHAPCLASLIITPNTLIPVNTKGKNQDIGRVKACPTWRGWAVAALGCGCHSAQLQSLHCESLPCPAFLKPPPSRRFCSPSSACCICAPGAIRPGHKPEVFYRRTSQAAASLSSSGPTRIATSLPWAPPLSFTFPSSWSCQHLLCKRNGGVAQTTSLRRWGDF